ncbi:MAG: DUF2442 domain-containing protein [Chloroflexota bacterium]
MNPYVKSVKPQADYCLLLTFQNGEKRIFDLKPYFEKPVFARLKNITLFKTVRVVSGAVEWQGEIDLSNDTLYLESKAVKATQSRRKTTHGQKKKLVIATAQRKKLPKARVAVK